MKQNRFLLEVRPFGNRCDFDCSHCYQSKSKSDLTLNPESLVSVLDIIAPFYSAVRIVFHGGEPLSDGGVWIVDAIRRIEKRLLNLEVSYLVHTASRILPIDFDFFRLRGILFGLSISPNDRGPSSCLISPLIKAACSSGLCAGIQIVLTSNFLSSIEGIRKAISLLPDGMNVKFIPCMGIGQATPYGILGEEYGKALLVIKRIADEDSLWKKHFLEPLTWCRNANNPIEVFKGCRFEPEKCSLQAGEVVSLAIDNDGIVYPCNRFAAIGASPIGSIYRKQWWSEVRAKLLEERTQMGEDVFDYTNCYECSSYQWGLCSGAGGCPFHRIFIDGGSEKMDPFCLGENMLLAQYLPKELCVADKFTVPSCLRDKTL